MTDTSPKVYIVQEQPKFDYSDAERFGHTRILTNKEYNGFRNSGRNRQAVQEIQMNLAEFEPDRDYLLMTGSPINMGFAFSVAFLAAARSGHTKLNILQWDREARVYKHIVFEA